MVEVADRTVWSASTAARERRGVQLLLLALAITAAVYAKRALSPLHETLRGALALTDNQMALLQGPALALPMLIAAIPLGLLVDRCSRVRLLLVLVGLILIGSLLTAFAPSFAVLFAARSLVGLAAFAMAPAALSLLADLYEPAQRGRANMVITVGQFAGGGAVFALGGSLVTLLRGETEAWRATMLWLTAPLVLVMGAMLAMREPPRTGRALTNPSTRDSFKELWVCRTVIVAPLLGIVMAEVNLQSIMTWAAPTLARRFALAPDRIGAIMGIAVPLGGIVGTVLGGYMADWCHRTGGSRRTIGALSVLALLCAPAGLFVASTDLMLASALFALLLAILNMTLVMGLTLFAIVIPNELRGLCSGILTGVGVLLAVGLAPVLVSALSEARGGPAMIGQALAAVCAGASLLGAATFALGRRSFAIDPIGHKRVREAR